jgi:hypothetical protein
MVDWTLEKIAKLSVDDVKSLRSNASNKKVQKVVELCDAELARRAPAQQKKSTTGARQSIHGRAVSEFHFVCRPKDKGVIRNSDGSLWTGTWVVDRKHAERGAKTGAHVALHLAKSEPSYLQGIVKDWRRSEREEEYAEDKPVQTEFGIDFLIEPINQPLVWKGDGAGEKGYAYSETQIDHPET